MSKAATAAPKPAWIIKLPNFSGVLGISESTKVPVTSKKQISKADNQCTMIWAVL
jgi:hypothetical protein